MLKITVPYKAAPGGSKTVMVNPKKIRTVGLSQGWARMISGKLWVRSDAILQATFVRDAGKGNGTWKARVAREAMAQLNIPKEVEKRTLLSMPLILAVEFWMPRPVNHYRKDGITLSAEGLRNPVPDKKPDLLKLMRSTEDALTGVVWVDDAQTCDQFLHKRYAETRDDVRVVINIFPATQYQYELSFRRPVIGAMQES